MIFYGMVGLRTSLLDGQYLVDFDCESIKSKQVLGLKLFNTMYYVGPYIYFKGLISTCNSCKSVSGESEQFVYNIFKIYLTAKV